MAGEAEQDGGPSDDRSNESLAPSGDPDGGSVRIVKNCDSDLVRLDRTGAHSVPWMDFKTPDPAVANYHVVLEGSATLDDPNLSGVDVQGPEEAASGPDVDFAGRSVPGELPEVIRWDSLSLNQQRVLTSAMEGESLHFLHLSWAASVARNINEGRNNRGGAYAAALIPAALSLVRLGMIGVVTADPELRILPGDEALAVAGDINNWWRYKVIPGLDDPLDPGPTEGGLVAESGWASRFALTQVNRDRFALSSWTWPPRMAPIGDD